MDIVTEWSDLTSYVLTDKEIEECQDAFRCWSMTWTYSISLLILQHKAMADLLYKTDHESWIWC